MGTTRTNFFQIIFLLLVGLLGCQNSSNQTKEEKIKDSQYMEQPELIMEPLHMTSYGPTGLDWELTAPTAQAFTSKNVMRANDLTVILYQEGQKSSTITSDKGIFRMNQNQGSDGNSSKLNGEEAKLDPGDMYLDGHVVVVSTDGTKLLTNWLHFRQKMNLIKTTAPVQVFREDSVTNGTGLEAVPDLSSVEIFNQTLVIKGDDEDGR